MLGILDGCPAPRPLEAFAFVTAANVRARWWLSSPTDERSRVSPRVKLQLVAPTERLRESFLRAARELRDEGLAWWIGGDLEYVEHDFAAFVAKKLDDASRRTETLVPKTHLWGVSDDQFVGRISIHHELTDALRLEGGHIGYDTVPSFRGRGVATELLRQALPVARTLGLSEVLLTCDDTNAASIRVIEKCGGVLRETRSLAPSRPPKRYYWIALP
jgi:predicted acetyltransferase